MMPLLQITPEAAKRMFRGFRFPPNKPKSMKYENTPMVKKTPPLHDPARNFGLVD
jgi:hypothetical protein